MTKEEAVLCYKTSMLVFKKWLADGIISEDELRLIETKLAAKYGLSLCSIYRDLT